MTLLTIEKISQNPIYTPVYTPKIFAPSARFKTQLNHKTMFLALFFRLPAAGGKFFSFLHVLQWISFDFRTFAHDFGLEIFQFQNLYPIYTSSEPCIHPNPIYTPKIAPNPIYTFPSVYSVYIYTYNPETHRCKVLVWK